MSFRLAIPFFLLGTLLSGCFEPACGPHQKLHRGKDAKLASAVCICESGYAFDEDLNCVKEGAAAPTPTPGADSDAGDGAVPAMTGGCDATTGLGCVCKGEADCASYPANYCVLPDPADPAMKRVCLYQGCDKPGKECPSLMHCCAFPFAPEKTICLPEEYECPFK